MSRQSALKNLFGKAKRLTITSDDLRETVVPEMLNGKHLHDATEEEINYVIRNISNSGNEGNNCRGNPPGSPYRQGAEGSNTPRPKGHPSQEGNNRKSKIVNQKLICLG